MLRTPFPPVFKILTNGRGYFLQYGQVLFHDVSLATILKPPLRNPDAWLWVLLQLFLWEVMKVHLIWTKKDISHAPTDS